MMPPRPTQTPERVIVRRTDGPATLTSVIAATITIGVTALAFLVGAAILLPAPYGMGAPITGAIAASPSPTAPTAATPRPSGPPTGSSLPGGASLSRAPVASPVPASSLGPAASPAPTATPATARLRSTVPLQVDGRQAGQVTVQALRTAMRPGIKLAADERVLVATVRLAATSRLRYDAGDWQLEDDAGDRWDALPRSPTDPLGAGTLDPSEARRGTIAFKVPRGRSVRSVVLTDGAGTDLVVFARSQASS